MRDLLRARGFKPRAVHDVDLPDDAGGVRVVEVDPPVAFDAWRALRDAGHLTVALTLWAGDVSTEELFSRFYYDDASPADVLAGARGWAPEDALREWPLYEPRDDEWPDILAVQLDRTREHVGEAPAPGELAGVRDEVELERRLLAYEEERRPTTKPEPGPHIDWYDPDRVLLVPLPVTAPEDALAYASFYGAEGAGRHDALIAILRGWRERFGATLYANWGTMLQFTVDRPPTDLFTAFELAAEHVRVAPCTTLLPGETLRSHARSLLGRDTWFLHERP